MSHNVTIALFELRNEDPATCIQDDRVPLALLYLEWNDYSCDYPHDRKSRFPQSRYSKIDVKYTNFIKWKQ